MSARFPPRSTRAGKPTPRGGFATLVARFVSLSPALLIGALCLRGVALWIGLPTGDDLGRLLMYVLRDDLLLFARALPVLFLLSWPLLLLRRPWLRTMAVGALWSLWLLVQVALEQYYLTARVPLGADLFGYSWQEILTTAGDGLRMDVASVSVALLPLLGLWVVLAWRAGRKSGCSAGPGIAVLIAGIVLWAVPLHLSTGKFASEDAYNLALNKTGYFIADNLAGAAPGAVTPVPDAAAQAPDPELEEPQTDPRYPFLHRERAPDVLGEHFNIDPKRPPNLVFIVVEGLGRSFSGPDAALDSFTPFLDELGERSLYFGNFLANQGRTFAVLPSVFGSLPFGEQGFAALEPMPPHDGLLRLLHRQGYGLRFYAGFDVNFDNERAYLQSQGVGHIVDQTSFGPAYARNPFTAWGYDDHALVARVLDDLPAANAGAARMPSVTVIQTMSMHTSYRFAGQEAYRQRFERRLDELKIPAADRARYRPFADIYSSVLFTDDALRRYFEGVQRDPGYANTIFIVTGDHRLPEIPMDTRIERYHVPLIVFSPLLKQPARIASVSSQLDIAPSLLAFLAKNYGLKRPERVTWTGDGLDMERSFRNLHDIPLKQTKTALSDFASGTWYLSRGQLFTLHDGMRIEPSSDVAGATQIQARFARYHEANDRFAQSRELAPEGAPPLVAYAAVDVRPLPSLAAAGGSVNVRDVRAPAEAAPGALDIDAVFVNETATPTAAIVPLLVLSDEQGRQLQESYAPPIQLAPGAVREVHFQLAAGRLPAGRYFLAVIPSHPDTGQPVGTGRYRIALRIRG